MIDLSAIGGETILGRALRLPFRWLPSNLVLPILQGPARGTRWVVGASTHGCWIGSYEAEVQLTCARLVRPGMVVYDLGANVGFYSLLFARLVGSGGCVHAFEPVPRNCQVFRRHLALNRISNVFLHPVAVAGATSTAHFDPGPNHTMGRIVGTRGVFDVQTTSLDAFVFDQHRSPPDFVKMDIEGGEAAALAGMRRLLRQRPPILLIATHGPGPAQECARILSAERYRIMDLRHQAIESVPEEGEILASASQEGSPPA